MPPRSNLIVVALLASALSGCVFQNVSPTEGLSDQVYLLNDESRWNRLDLAVRRVAPSYRQRFVDSRRAWGRDVEIADTEVSALVLAEDTNSATSRVEISWYDRRSMVLRSTTLRQSWTKTDGGFLLDGETVIGGDDTLLAPPDQVEAVLPASSG
jgi:hypothetical protein